MRRRTIVDDIEIVMRERLWLPWYERYGPDFQESLLRYPLSLVTPPDDDYAGGIAVGPGTIWVGDRAAT